MSGVQLEPRTAIHALVKVSWEEESGAAHDASAWMEDTSPSGACIRVNRPVAVGATVKVNWRWGEFSGVTKYCRNDGKEYVLGLQRIKGSIARNVQIRTASQRQSPATQHVQPLPTASPSRRNQGKSDQNESPKSPIQPESKAVVSHTAIAAQVPRLMGEVEPVSQDQAPDSGLEGHGEITPTEMERQRSAHGEERTNMAAKWLEKTLKREKQETAPNGNNNTQPRGKDSSRAADSSDDMPSGLSRPRPQGDLQSLEDVYRAAGIINPRMGYSVTKVVEMMGSDHIRGLQQDAKRAAILMALDAAGVSVEEVLRDALMRQNALEVYETEQRKTFEDYWARRNEGNDQIRQELEQVKAEYLARIKRTTDEIAMEKTKFANWQAKKKLEVERIAEAVGLCSKADERETSTNPMSTHKLEPEGKLA